ncbi:MAG: hypothetical protein ABIO18_11050 [Croceibacterium sp.]
MIAMALALLLAAFLGGGLGLVWHAAGFGNADEPGTAVPTGAKKG